MTKNTVPLILCFGGLRDNLIVTFVLNKISIKLGEEFDSESNKLGSKAMGLSLVHRIIDDITTL